MIRLNMSRHSIAFLFAYYLCGHIQISPSEHRCVVSAFSPLVMPAASVRHENANSQTLLRMSEPSDTSSDSFYEYVDVDSEETQPTNDEALVLNVLDLIPEDHRAGFATSAITEETRTAINEALYKLEALHTRTSDPAVSPLLNGVWQLRYVGGYASQWALPSPTRQLALFLYSGGYSPGIFALGLAQNLPRPFVEVGRDVEVAISRTQVRLCSDVD